MLSIPLKNNSGTVSLLSPHIIEIKKLHMTILVFKPLNRICIYPEGRISIYQQNTSYTSEHDFTVDKFNIEAVKEMLISYMAPQITASNMLEGNYQNTCPLINEYRENFRMINTELKSMCNMTINVHEEIEGHLNNLQVEIENIKQSHKINYNNLFLNVFIGLLLVLFSIYMFNPTAYTLNDNTVVLPYNTTVLPYNTTISVMNPLLVYIEDEQFLEVF